MTGVPIHADDSPSFVAELVYRLKIRDAMSTRLITAGRDTHLRDIQTLMKESAVTGIPIVDGVRLVGIVSMDDVIRALDAGYIDKAAESHMTRNVIVLEDDMPIAFAINYLDRYRFGRFPVLNKERELVGIITSRDIIVKLLLEINHEIERLEALENAAAAKETEEGRIRRTFRTRPLDFENAGKPSTAIKRILTDRRIPKKEIRRAAVAAYELEMNQVVHSSGGTITLDVDADRIEIVASDRGPGIDDVEAALTEGFSTATDWVRSLGFGAGMGLPNTRRVCDDFEVRSSKGHPTTVRGSIHLRPNET